VAAIAGLVQPVTARSIGLGAALVVLATGCAVVRPAPVAVPPTLPGPSPTTGPPSSPGTDQTGVASWYGERHHGRRTANGESYDMQALTAAHPTLPFGTIVAVTNLRNGRTVEVRINDRGPHVGGRLIDLSYAAARAVGLLEMGIGTVRVRVVGPPGTERPVAGESATTGEGAPPVPPMAPAVVPVGARDDKPD
jgi:rare lipoprotein A